MALEAVRTPNGWAHTSLEAVCQILDSKRIPVNNSERSRRITGKAADDLYPYYGATGQVGVIDDFIFEGEHILLGEDGAPFLDPFKVKSYLVGGKFWVNNHAHILKPTISNRYLCYYLNQIDYSDHVTGTTRLKLTQNALKRIPVLVAPTAEQHRIVAKIEELFSELDKGIESLKAAQAQLKVYRQAVLKHAFEGKLTAQWREENKDKLETPEQLLARIRQDREVRYEQQLQEWKAAVKEWEDSGKSGKKPTKPKRSRSISLLSYDTLDSLTESPDGWTWLKLEDVCNRITDGEHFRPPVTNEGVYFLSAKDVREDGVSFDDPLYISKETAEKALARCNPEYGDLLVVSRGATVGRTCVVKTSEKFCLLGSVILIKPGKVLDNLYLSFFLRSSRVNQILARLSGSTAQQAIYLRDIKNVNISVCSLPEQQEIVRLLEERFAAIEWQEREIDSALRQAETLRQAILKKAFAGQLVPQDPHDEPASVLLDRIRAEREKALQNKHAKKTKKRKTRA